MNRIAPGRAIAQAGHFGGARHVEAREGRDEAVAHAEVRHLFAPTAAEKKLAEALTGPSKAQVALVD
ncbi:MAG: hypothetical protein AAF938_09900, partial [Myxococcota bacterium]